MHTVLFVALALGASFEDAQGRYTLELPGGWRLTRAESTPEAPVFRAKKRRKGVATASIRISSVPDAIGLGGVHRRRLDAVKALRGATLVEDGAAVLDGYRGRTLSYTVDRDGARQTVRELMTQVHNRGFVLTFAAETKHMDAFSEDFDALLRDFSIVDPKKKQERASRGSPLVGRWVKVKNPKSVLVLSADGSMEMGADSGSYAVSRDTIVTLLSDGGQSVYQWDVKGRTLVLRTDRGPVKYRRAN